MLSINNVQPDQPVAALFYKGGGSLGGMQFRISAILLPCFRKSADGDWLFPLFLTVMSKVFLLHIKYNIQHKPFSFHFARDRSDSSCLQSSWVIILRENFCCCCCYCGCCLQIFVIQYVWFR